MGPGGFMGPPPSAMNEKLKEPLPKRLREVPGYLKKVSKMNEDFPNPFYKWLLELLKLEEQAKK